MALASSLGQSRLLARPRRIGLVPRDVSTTKAISIAARLVLKTAALGRSDALSGFVRAIANGSGPVSSRPPASDLGVRVSTRA